MNTIQKVVFTLLLGIVGCQETPKEKKVSDVQPNTDIYKIELTDLKGQPIDVKQYNGKTVFVNVWATWCKPCIKEMPSIEKAQNILRSENVVFLLASNESAEEIEGFRNNHEYTFNYIRIENPEALNIQSIPTTFIFNPGGDLVFSETGSRTWDDSTSIQMILKIAK